MMAINGDSIKALRRKRRESQTTFWRRFGVTQSRGSRFELGVDLPSSVTILLELYLAGVIRDSDLLRARQRTKSY
jgi:DNA-binding transcriptional regulator YiaG